MLEQFLELRRLDEPSPHVLFLEHRKVRHDRDVWLANCYFASLSPTENALRPEMPLKSVTFKKMKLKSSQSGDKNVTMLHWLKTLPRINSPGTGTTSNA
jgi:hypothetical protein